MDGPPAHEITDLLIAAQAGSPDDNDRLMAVVYQELKRLASGYLRGERADHTLQPTALVHEAYLRLIEQTRINWQNRSHFFGIAAQAMRRILVDYARRRQAGKRDGLNVTLDDELVGLGAAPEIVIAVDEAVADLAKLDPRQARIVELRYFGGLTIEQIAEALEISPAKVRREWTSAKAWLQRELGDGV